MKKNSIQDIIPSKRSIRDIEPPSRARKVKEKTVSDVVPSPKITIKKEPTKVIKKTDDSIDTDDLVYKYEYNEPKTKKRFGWKSAGLVVGVLLVAFFISSFFKSAEIRITPIQEVKDVNDVFSAKKDTTTTGLGYQIVTTSKELEKTIEASGEQQVEKKSRGTIVIYNNYSNQEQRLIATTRFETPEGLIFRAVTGVTVPGRQTKDGKTVAGSAEVVVEADIAGEKYNIGLKDFTIVGFKGTPKYSQIYARSKTPMTGGFSGVQKVVPQATMDSVDLELKNALTEALLKDIKTQIPANFVLYDEGIEYEFEPTSQVNSSSNSAVLKKKATVSAIIFDKGSLSKTILTKVLPSYAGEAVMVANLNELDFSIQNSEEFNHKTSTNLSFSVSGKADFVWIVDENKLKSDLLGLSQKNANAVIATYSNIREAWVETAPFWNSTIPDDPERVTLINTLTK